MLNESYKEGKKIYVDDGYANDMHGKKMYIEEIQQGIILPLKGNKGGVCDKYGNFIKESINESDWKNWGGYYSYIEKEVIYVKDKVMFLGYHINHWGHFLIEELTRFWAIGEKEDCKYVLLNTDDKKIEGNYLEALHLLGIKDEQLIEVNKLTSFDIIYVPSPSLSKNKGYALEFCSIFKKMANKVNLDDYNIAEKIYLSRQRYGSCKGKEFGEETIEKAFRRAGYEIKYPETLSVCEQIAIFQKANKIACINGTIPLMALFASSRLNLIVINKTSLVHKNLHQVCNIRNISPTYIDAYYEPINNHPRYLGEGPFWIDNNENITLFLKENEGIDLIPEKKSFLKKIKYYYMYIKIRIVRNNYLFVRHKLGLIIKYEKK